MAPLTAPVQTTQQTTQTQTIRSPDGLRSEVRRTSTRTSTRSTKNPFRELKAQRIDATIGVAIVTHGNRLSASCETPRSSFVDDTSGRAAMKRAAPIEATPDSARKMTKNEWMRAVFGGDMDSELREARQEKEELEKLVLANRNYMKALEAAATMRCTSIRLLNNPHRERKQPETQVRPD